MQRSILASWSINGIKDGLCIASLCRANTGRASINLRRCGGGTVDFAFFSSTTRSEQDNQNHKQQQQQQTVGVRRKRFPRNHWSDPKNRRQFFDEIARDLNIQQPSDWYKVTLDQILARGGRGVIAVFNSSLIQALRSVYPEHEWDESLFLAQVTRGYWKDLANQRRFFDRIAQELGIRNLEDWYNVTSTQVKSLGGGGLLVSCYKSSLSRALQAVYPEHPWDPSKFSRVSNTYWKDLANQRRFFDNLAAELDIQTPDGWYNVVTETVYEKGGRGLLSRYRGSLARALRAVYPEHSWDPSKFSRVPRGFWNSIENQRQCLEAIGKELGVQQLDDWYSVTTSDVKAKGAETMLYLKHSGSLIRALKTVYPDHPWEETRFTKVQRGYWTSLENQRKFFDNLGCELGIKQLDDWCSVGVEDLRARGAASIINSHYGGSLVRALRAIYPEHEWSSFSFRLPNGYWKDPTHQREFFDELAKKLDIQRMDDWYNITVDKVCSHGGATLMDEYNNSIARALMSIYPDHPWQHWKFSRVSAPSSANSDSDMLKDYMTALAKELDIQHLDDWYRASLDQLRNFGGYGLIKRNGGLVLVLKRLHPEHKWDESKFAIATGKKKSSQRWLLLILQKIFPNEEILEDYLHPDLLFHASNQPMELDIYIPALGLAFEYHGQYHYSDMVANQSTNASMVQSQDQEKIRACEAAGITLVPVPYWWDRTTESIVAMIKAQRPDLIVNNNNNNINDTIDNTIASTSETATGR